MAARTNDVWRRELRADGAAQAAAHARLRAYLLWAARYAPARQRVVWPT